MSFLALPTLQFILYNFPHTSNYFLNSLLFVLRILKIDMGAELTVSDSGLPIVKTYVWM